MERIPNLPEWAFKGEKLVTVNKIRRERIGDDWVGDESNGFLKEQLHINREEIIPIEERLKTF